MAICAHLCVLAPGVTPVDAQAKWSKPLVNSSNRAFSLMYRGGNPQ
jgi:hypothetical protein